MSKVTWKGGDLVEKEWSTHCVRPDGRYLDMLGVSLGFRQGLGLRALDGDAIFRVPPW